MTDTPSGIEQRDVEAIVALCRARADEYGARRSFSPTATTLDRAADMLTTLLTENARLREMVQPSEGLGR